MKSKKMLTILLAFALLLTFSQSAFAISGRADSRETAININDIYLYNSYLDYNDVDWFEYTNTSGLREVLNLTLKSSSIASHPANYDMYVYYKGPNGNELVLNPYEVRPNEDFAAVAIQPGSVVYIKVVGHTIYDFGDQKSYTLIKEVTH